MTGVTCSWEGRSITYIRVSGPNALALFFWFFDLRAGTSSSPESPAQPRYCIER
ncbi:hypothetical protein BDV98DRAFT_558549 [Pterulicium gracile]|uniref:Uncharacterized protein n=1 Tax=Pterulicium gracile TaxID=1884261 RepID=A0A5C3R2B5_9AGAR|nr:hypothetical protein BDV98DRAFT_558549 [Pterula gracilis]